jgi:HigB_toxin, RelE-like toxic component of a toxin-antitoxin system
LQGPTPFNQLVVKCVFSGVPLASIIGLDERRNVKAAYPKASILKASRVVFNIKGNDFRLVVAVQYRAGALAIRFFGSGYLPCRASPGCCPRAAQHD